MFRSVRSLALAVVVVAGSGVAAWSAGPAKDGEPGGDTAQAQLADLRAVEGVYWNARLWPEVNPEPKPSLDAVFPVGEALARSNRTRRTLALLERRWGVRLDARELQHELDRIAAATKSPARLRALFAALDDDAARIARALVLPRLAERVADRLVADDAELQSAARARANSAAEMSAEQPEEVVYVPATVPEAERPAHADVLDAAAWTALVRDVASGRRVTVRESRRSFVIDSLVEHGPARIVVGRRIVPKQTLDAVLDDVSLVSDTPEDTLALDRFAGLRLPDVDTNRADFGAANCTDDTWEDYFVEPSPRGLHTAVWTGSEMIVWGGYHDHETYDDGGRYDPVTDSWTPVSRVGAPAARTDHTAVWTGTRMIVWGGGDANVTDLNTGGRYDPATNTWAPVTTTGAPAARRGHIAAWTGSEMIVWGGIDDFSTLGPGGRYNPSTNAWTPLPSSGGPAQRPWSTAVWTGTQMLVFGGGHEGPSAPGDVYADTWAYTPSSNSWSLRAAFPGAARTRHTAVWTGSQMIVWGGDGLVYDAGSDEWIEASLNDGWRFTASTNSWTAVGTTGSLPDARYLHTAVWSGTQMIVYGGRGGFNAGAYNPTTNVWSNVTRTNSPGGFYELIEHSAVWAGTTMIVWGGLASNGVVSEGGRYAPGTNSWTPTSDSNAPLTRAEQTTVWTGAEMIVHGGRTLEPLTTYRYDPALDHWSLAAASSLTGTLTLHTAVWSGTEMIVWGGLLLPSTSMGDGGRYNPTTNTWTPGTATGAPAPRYRHVAGWIGTEMIVWGGTTNDATGGRYTPSTNAWTATSTTNAPAGRNHPVAVVTPTKFVVWGGYNTGGNVGTGGRYDWATNSWTPTTATGAPSARQRHTGVWTGNEMIVWGGTTAASPNGVNDGARYDPAADTWTAMNLTGAPAGRGQHLAVWTGTKMVVWGGANSLYLTSGGRYDPQANAWSPTSLDRTPCGRKSDSAVWSGSEMLVFGGDISNRVPIGGRYCAGSGCTPSNWYLDADGDGRGNPASVVSACVAPSGYVADATDCSDSDANSWATPGEVRSLALAHNRAGGISTLTWLQPTTPGANSAGLRYDVLRAASPQGFGAGVCVETNDAGETAQDATQPAAGAAFHYLVRARNGCPQGSGTLGNSSAGVPRSGRSCP